MGWTAAALWLTLGACRGPEAVQPTRDAHPSGDAPAPPPSWAPPPPITLSQSPLVAGFPATFTVGPMQPGETAWVVYSPWPGPGPCLPVILQGQCFGIGLPTLLGTEVADGDGTASFTRTVTLPFSPDPAYTQAVVQHHDGSVTLSAPLERTVQDVLTVWFGDAVVVDAVDLAALAGVGSITGDLLVEGTALTSVELPDLTHVGGEVRVWENFALLDLQLPALTWVGGDLSIYDDPGLIDLSGLGALEQVGGALALNRLPGLNDLTGLEQLHTVGGKVYLFHDTGLATLDGLDGLATVGSKIDLWELYALQTASLPALQRLGGRLDVFDATVLTTLSAPQLTVAGGLELHNAEAMTTAGDFPVLTELGSLIVKYNDSLVDLSGLEALQTVNAGIEVVENPSLQTLGGLDTVLTLGRDLDVHDNTALTALALPSLTEADDLIVLNNGVLADPGLAALQILHGDATVGGNPALSQCALDALFDRITVTGLVQCAENLDDGCSGWCQVDTGGP